MPPPPPPVDIARLKYEDTVWNQRAMDVAEFYDNAKQDLPVAYKYVPYLVGTFFSCSWLERVVVRPWWPPGVAPPLHCPCFHVSGTASPPSFITFAVPSLLLLSIFAPPPRSKESDLIDGLACEFVDGILNYEDELTSVEEGGEEGDVDSLQPLTTPVARGGALAGGLVSRGAAAFRGGPSRTVVQGTGPSRTVVHVQGVGRGVAPAQARGRGGPALATRGGRGGISSLALPIEDDDDDDDDDDDEDGDTAATS
jgi:hypothetical protein